MLLDDIRSYLVSRGISTAAWPTFIGYMPDSTDQMIGLFETGGYPPVELNRENELVTFQLRVRGSHLNYATTRLKWKACFDAIQDAQAAIGSPASLPGVTFIQAMHNGPLHSNDDKGRPNFTSNFRCKRAYS